MGGPLRIPISEVYAYSAFYELDITKRHDLLSFVEHLDTAFMEHMDKMREESERKGKTPDAVEPAK